MSVTVIPPGRRGFSLPELLVALVLLGVVSLLLYSAVINSQRLSRSQVERASLQSNVRTGSSLVLAELRELGVGPGSQTDIIAMGADSITYRGMRGLGVLCEASAGQLKIRDDIVIGLRGIDATRDDILLLVDNDSTLNADDQWVALDLASVTTGVTCAGGVAATALNLASAIPSGTLAGVVLGSPVRYFETMQLRQFASGGRQWLGLRSVTPGDSLLPVVGPLATSGLQLTFLDSTGTSTANTALVRRIQLTLRGETDRVVNAAAGQSGQNSIGQDSVTTQIALRNATKP